MRIQKNITKQQAPQVGQLKKTSYRQNFKGIDTVVIGTMDAIERGGLFASFVTQDFLGTILPRPLAGLSRNKKENNGKINTTFALKEATREFITGPSMFIIPMGILAVTKKHIGKALDVPTNFIKGLGDIFKNNVDLNNLTDPKAFKQDYYENVFKDILSNSTSQPIKDIEVQARQMADKLANAKGKTPFISRIKAKYVENSIDDVTNSLTKGFIELNKLHAKDASKDFLSAQMTPQDGKEVSESFRKLITHMTDYADDVVEKTFNAVTKNTKSNVKENVKDFIENLNHKRINGRFALNLGMAAAVIGFLSITPNLYNRTKENPGLIGLDTTPIESNKEKGDVKNANK